MSNSAGNWEVVGGGKTGKKKHSQENGHKMNKNQKKKIIENMPRLKESDPIKETQTIFEAFLEKDRKNEELQKKEHSITKSNGNAEPTKSGKKVSNQPKKKDKEKKDSKDAQKGNTFEDVASQVTCEDLQTLLDLVQAKFPDAPSIWMKDLASFLNLKLSCDISDPTFIGKPPMYPTSVMSSGIHSLLLGTIRVCTSQTLDLFFEHCLLSLAQDMVNNIPTYGYTIFLQCLASEHPELIINALPKFVELRNYYQNRHNVCLSLLWVAGQAGLTDINNGLKVWLELMFPVVSMRAFSKYAVEYLETLFKCHSNAKSATDVLGVREFFPVFDFLHSQMGNHGPYHKQLQALYPRLKSLAYGTKPDTILRNFFPSYLSRLLPTSSSAMIQELLNSLVECLTKDKHCYSIWRQLYTKHLVQSSLLLGHLSKELERAPSGFPHKLLKETLHTFKVTNEEFSAQHKTSLDGYADCVKHCNELLSKMSVWRFPWRLLIFLIVASAATIVIYDINIHGSFRASKTGKLLKEYGVLAVCQQAWGKISIYSRRTFRWMEKNLPVYYNQLRRVSGPYVQQFFESLSAAAIYLWQASLPAREWFNVNIPPLLQKVSDNLPILMAHISTWLSWAMEAAQVYTLWLWKQAAIITLAIGTWLQEHVFTGQMSIDSLQRLAGQAVGHVQQYTQNALNWLTQMVSNA